MGILNSIVTATANTENANQLLAGEMGRSGEVTEASFLPVVMATAVTSVAIVLFSAGRARRQERVDTAKAVISLRNVSRVEELFSALEVPADAQTSPDPRVGDTQLTLTDRSKLLKDLGLKEVPLLPKTILDSIPEEETYEALREMVAGSSYRVQSLDRIARCLKVISALSDKKSDKPLVDKIAELVEVELLRDLCDFTPQIGRRKIQKFDELLIKAGGNGLSEQFSNYEALSYKSFFLWKTVMGITAAIERIDISTKAWEIYALSGRVLEFVEMTRGDDEAQSFVPSLAKKLLEVLNNPHTLCMLVSYEGRDDLQDFVESGQKGGKVKGPSPTKVVNLGVARLTYYKGFPSIITINAREDYFAPLRARLEKLI